MKVALKEAEHIRFHGEARHTWKEAVVAWADSKPEIGPATMRRYLVSLGRLRGILDDLFVDEISSRTVAQIARRAGASNATRRRDITAVSVVLRWCAGQGWREDNPARTWDRSVIKERREPIVLPEPYDIDCVVAEAPGNFAKLIRFAQYTGMRQDECASLERLQVDLRRQAVMLTRTKTNRPRAVPLDERAVGTIAGTLPKLNSSFIFWHGRGGDRYLNVASRFAELTQRAQASAKAARHPIPRRFRFHDLRHWFAVDYLRRGGNVYDLQKILGHSSIKTTELYLAYLTPEEQDVSIGKTSA
jgi:integrase/recombinase XerD